MGRNRQKGREQVAGLKVILRWVFPNLVGGGYPCYNMQMILFFFLKLTLLVLEILVILCYFEHLSRLKINFHKSEICCFGEATQEIEALKVFSPMQNVFYL